MFTNALESMAKAEITKIEVKLAALDLDKDGIPDLAEAKKLLSEGVTELQVLEAKVTPDEIANALNVLFPGKFTAVEIAAGEAAINKLISAVQHLAAITSNVKASV